MGEGPVSQSKQRLPTEPEERSEVKPDTEMHGVTGLGHVDFLSIEQMLAAAVWLSPRRPRNGSTGPWMDAVNYPVSPGKEMTHARHSRRSQGHN